LLVNTTTYLDSAYLKFDLGLTRDINQDFKDLKKDNSSDLSFLNVLIDEKSMKERKSGIGYNLTVRSSNSEQTIKLNIIDSFRNWPILKYKFQYWDSMTLVIGDISYYTLGLNKTLANSPFPDQNDRGILFNFKDGVNQTLVSSWIEGNTSITIRSLTAESQKQFYTGIQFRLQVGQINNDVIMVIAISITVLIMFAYLQLSERRKEIFTERAMGMKLHQIASLFFIETIILSFTSILLGLGVGVFLMELLALLILNPLQTYPAYEIIFPIEIILITNLLILISSLIVSVVPAYYVTKQDISKSFVEG
jgi:ABC-type antimicrobial peptide transport system permease subunit